MSENRLREVRDEIARAISFCDDEGAEPQEASDILREILPILDEHLERRCENCAYGLEAGSFCGHPDTQACGDDGSLIDCHWSVSSKFCCQSWEMSIDA